MRRCERGADHPVRHGTVRTPLAEASAISVEREVVAIPVLRAGLGLLAPVLELLPRVSVGYIGLEGDEETAVARIYYKKLPKLKGKVPLLLDPMLATGGSAAQALGLIKEAGGGEKRVGGILGGGPGGGGPPGGDGPRGATPRGPHLPCRPRRTAQRQGLHRPGPRRLRRPPLRHGLSSPL